MEAKESAVTIEFCKGCEKHSMSLRHDENKYRSTYEQFKKLLEVSNIPVIEKQKYRVGAFEVVVDGIPVYSKLKNGGFPLVMPIVTRIMAYFSDRNVSHLGVDNGMTMTRSTFTNNSLSRQTQEKPKSLVKTNSFHIRATSVTDVSHSKRLNRCFSGKKINNQKYTQHFRPEQFILKRTRRLQDCIMKHYNIIELTSWRRPKNVSSRLRTVPPEIGKRLNTEYSNNTCPMVDNPERSITLIK